MPDDNNNNNTPPQDNSTIRAMREQIGNLETQISNERINSNLTKSELETLKAQKAQLESEVAKKLELEAELTNVKTRATELETRFQAIVDEELKTIPSEKLEAVKSMLTGLSPDQQMDKIKSLKILMEVPNSPPPANPPGPPQGNPTSQNPPPAGDQKTDFQKLVEDTKAGKMQPGQFVFKNKD